MPREISTTNKNLYIPDDFKTPKYYFVRPVKPNELRFRDIFLIKSSGPDMHSIMVDGESYAVFKYTGQAELLQGSGYVDVSNVKDIVDPYFQPRTLLKCGYLRRNRRGILQNTNADINPSKTQIYKGDEDLASYLLLKFALFKMLPFYLKNYKETKPASKTL